ncbi:hypothetical protein K7432_014308 [Basidiobolus ranarum]|uniref:Carrier domain-containing protein n=1 Tax=Basidiobolus ranarum TaxID=34480 RepID=A0ABR2WHT4_9FUNG
MIPAAFVRLDTLPLTINGKIDRKALPEPDDKAFAHQTYEEPLEGTETLLASIWSELLKIERISRNDSFFALGGHSLLAIKVIERLRRLGLMVPVRLLFDTTKLSALAQSLNKHREVNVPLNLITSSTTKLTPDLLPLIQLTQADIDSIIQRTPGGVANIQDIYALSPLQDGILFHHLMTTKGDPYLLTIQMTFDNRELVDRFLDAVQQVVNRHDILRTAFVWDNICTPAQVVWRHAPLSISKLALSADEGPAEEQLRKRFDPRQYRMDLSQAPLIHFIVGQNSDGRWTVIQLLHHLIGDHSTLEEMNTEIQAFLEDQSEAQPAPRPFRNLVALAQLGVSQEAHHRFFTDMLAEVDEPTLPFGLTEVHHDGADVSESHRMLPQLLNDRLRVQAKILGVSLASLCHLAWAHVLARTSSQQRVVFGTVLSGRLLTGEGADRAMGLYMNTLPIRIDVDGHSVIESVRQTHGYLAALMEHEHASLAQAQRCSNVPAGTPLFSALLNYRHNAMPISCSIATSLMEFIGAHEHIQHPGIEIVSSQERTNYPFMMSVEDFGTALGLTAQVVQPLDGTSLCDYMQKALEHLVHILECTPDVAVQQLEILPDEERELLVEIRNATCSDYPQYQCIHQLFEQQVEFNPDATALVYGDQILSYDQLNACANNLAHRLIELGVQPDMRVAICVERSPAMMVGLLAILKAGGAYVPLDPAYPRDRLIHIIGDATPSILLADVAGRSVIGEELLASLIVLDPNSPLPMTTVNLMIPALTSRHLAYVVYTSGSTGVPKGVMIEHRSVVNLIKAQTVSFRVDSSSRILQFASFSFDVSVSEIFTALCCGASLYLPPDAIRRHRNDLFGYLENHNITHATLPPALLQDGKGLPILSTNLKIILTGEAPSVTLVQTLANRGLVFNAYGPTETTVWATVWKCLPDLRSEAVPIGRPMTNTRIYILDMHGQLVPSGAIGEVYIGGVGVARGYLNRPELTTERFIRDPFSAFDDARMYRTGDLARYEADGNLVFLGRNDQQVKIRGYRIEPGEIESCLMKHSYVREAVVIVLDEESDKRLVAYIVAEPDEQLPHLLREHLTSMLPEYMIPASFVRLDILPLTPNSKLDRRALPLPNDQAFSRYVYEAPQGAIEISLAEIWSELLNVKLISRHDNFFTLGGHSLLAVQMIEHLHRINIKISVRALFDSSNLRELASSLDKHSEVIVPQNHITPATASLIPDLLPLIHLTQAEIDRIVEQTPGGVSNIQDIYSLAPLQDGILFHHLLATEGDPYLLVTHLAFNNRELLDRYLAAVQQVVNRHDILRTAFIWENLSNPAQVVWRNAALFITEISVNGYNIEQLKEQFDPSHHRIDLTQAPLLHFVIAPLSDGKWLVIQLLHHLIGDHSTQDAMNAEIKAILDGQCSSLPSPQPFRNLVAQARLGMSQQAHDQFFTDMLGEVDEPTLPFGLSDVHGDGGDITESHQMLSQQLNNRLRVQARRLGVSVASLCHLAWAQVLACISSQQQVVFGTVLLGRMHAGQGANCTMGLFMNTLPIRIDIDNVSVQDGVRQAHSRLASLLEHENSSLVLAQRCSRVLDGVPLFSALLNYRHNEMLSNGDTPAAGIEILACKERTSYPFTLSVDDYSTALGLTAQTVQPFDPSCVCCYMHKALESLASALEISPNLPICQLDILPNDERRAHSPCHRTGIRRPGVELHRA